MQMLAMAEKKREARCGEQESYPVSVVKGCCYYKVQVRAKVMPMEKVKSKDDEKVNVKKREN
jgi:hypothetical protein